MNVKLFFGCLFLFQFLFIFQGVDIGDSGSYATFYQQIFHDPESVQYNFMFWLSGILGGGYMQLFPSLGMWGLRLMGVLISTATILIAYNFLKRYLHKGNLQLSLFILVLFVNNNPKEFYYNNLSAFLYVVTSHFLFSGLKRDKKIAIFLSGVFIALNVFARLPNVLGLGFIVFIFYYGYLHQDTLKKQFQNALLLIMGFALSVVVLLFTMYLPGHLHFFINALELLSSMSKGIKRSDGPQNSYGILHLIRVLQKQYLVSILSAIIFFLFVLLVIPLANNIKKKVPVLKLAVIVLKYYLLISLFALIISGKIDNIIILYFFTGLSLVTAVLILISCKNKDLKFITTLGCFIALVHPMGSSEGIHTVIIYSLWLSFPIAIDYLLNFKLANIDVKILNDQNDFTANFLVNSHELREVKRIMIILMLFACAFYSYFYPYFDKSNRLYMTYSINNKHMKGIYTSQKRAIALNELLAQSAKYVKPDDYVLAYDCMPLYHYMTDTKPYLKNPWPWLYQSNIFSNELNKAFVEKKTLPIVITQIVKTMGDGGDWPYGTGPENSLNWKINEGRNNTLNEFLKKNYYREVWTNNCFKIFIPEKN